VFDHCANGQQLKCLTVTDELSKALLSWIVAQGIGTALIEPGKPWPNGVTESFNGHGSMIDAAGRRREVAARKNRRADGQTRDIPVSDAILVHVMWPSTPAGRDNASHNGIPHVRSTMKTVSAPANSSFRGSLPHPTHPLCTLRVRRHTGRGR
jgi:hypothetical protein